MENSFSKQWFVREVGSVSHLYNLDSLKTQLVRVGVEPDSYSLGEAAYGMYCIAANSEGDWETFTLERSQKYDLKVWASEEDACLAYLGRIAWMEWGR